MRLNKMQFVFGSIVWIASVLCLDATVFVKVSEPKAIGSKVIIKLEMKNGFSDKIESARAVVFLMDDQGKVVGQMTRWVIGGTKDKPALAPDAKTTFNSSTCGRTKSDFLSVLYGR